MAPIRLEVYVDDDCMTCSRSFAIAAEVQDMFPEVEVLVLGPQDEAGDFRHLVAAVPTYILNGKVVSLGNPTAADLGDTIRHLAAGARRW